MHHHLSLRSKIIIMMSVMASLFLVALDQTIIATALGKIVSDFNAFDSLSMIVTVYLLTTTITVPIAGKLSDLFGRRLILLIGVAIFTSGSLLSGISGNVEQLIAFRALQGIGGGIITANAFTIIGDLFAARERGRWQGLFGAVFGLSSIVGPLLGGWLTDSHMILGAMTSWRWTFFINVPVGILAFVLIAVFCPSLRHDKKPRIDYLGAVLIAIALGSLVLAVDNTAQIFKGFLDSSGMPLGVLQAILYGIAAVATALFIYVERKTEEPILPTRFFKNRNYVLIIGIATLFGAAFLGSILYLTQFNQQVFGASPTDSGLMLLPMIAGLMVTSIGSGQIISRTGHYKIFMQVGIVVATLMVGLLTTLTPQSPYLYEAIIMVFLGGGLGIVLPVMNLAVQNEFEQRDLGAATSSSQLFRSLGSTIGVAVFGGLLTSGVTAHLTNIESDPYIKSLSQSAAAAKIGDLSDSNTLLNLNMSQTKSTINEGFNSAIAKVPEPAKTAATETFTTNQQNYSTKIVDAFSTSLQRIFIVSTGLMLAAGVLVFSLKEKRLKSASPDTSPGVE